MDYDVMKCTVKCKNAGFFLLLYYFKYILLAMKHTELICRRGEIQEVVHQLEGDADVAAVLEGGFHSLRTRAGQHSYGLRRKSSQYKIT
jgi:hypothetical protein